MSASQKRMSCAHCEAEWWYTPGSVIDPADHRRPNGQACPKSRPVEVAQPVPQVSP